MKNIIDWDKISYTLIFFIFMLFVLPSLGFIFGLSISRFYIIFSLAVSVGFLCFKMTSVKGVLYSLGVFCFMLTSATIIASLLYDYSFDGRWYHQIAMIYLKNGWNPIYQNMSNLSGLKDFLIAEIWIENYNKAFEIIGSNFYTLTDRIESGKTQNLILLIAVFVYGSYALILYTSHRFKAIVFSFCLTCSPVVMSQFLTNYLDGFLSLLFLLALFAILKIEKWKQKKDFAILGIAFVLLAGSKLTGIVYAGIIGVFYLCFCLIFKRNIRKTIAVGIVSCFLIFITNLNPWITNLLNEEHIFYPLMGEKKVDIITPHTTKEFAQKNRFEQFFISIFSKTQNKNLNQNDPVLKIPFTTDKSEERLSVSDTRIGGFGFLFSGIIVFAFLVCLLGMKRAKKSDVSIFILFLLIIVVTTFINPAPWWARYVPQVWFLPLFALFFFAKRRILIVVGVSLALTNIVEAFALSIGSALMYSLVLRGIDNNLVDRKIIVQPLSDVEKSHIAKFKERGIDIIQSQEAQQGWDAFVKELLREKCGISEDRMSPIKKIKMLFSCS